MAAKIVVDTKAAAPATPAAATPQQPAAAQPTATAAAPKWEPLPRDYQMEQKALAVRLESADAFHPLMGRQELLDAQVRSAGGSDEKGVATASASSSSAGSAGGSAGAAAPLKSPAKDEKKPPKSDFDDPLRMLGGGGGGGGGPLSPSKPQVDDPLRGGGGNGSGSGSSSSATGTAAPSAVRNFSTAAASLLNPGAAAKDLMPDSKRIAMKPRRKSNFEMWTEKRTRILKKYTTNQKVAVTADFLDDQEEKKAIVAVDQTQQRLATLETGDTETSKSYMSQKEYIAHIEEQHQKLKTAWDADQRVLALKIVIQCAKLLGDTTVPQFYPSMFVLLSEILDTFGDLVFERIKRRGVEIVTTNNQIKTAALPANFKSTDVCSSAKETCRNWFYKTACIRELLPRLYIDLALIKSYRFLEDGTYPQILDRLSRGIRGIGDPLVATYARSYLASKALAVSDSFIEDNQLGDPQIPATLHRTLIEAFDDFQYTYKQLKADNFTTVSHIKHQKVDLDTYIDLYSPAIEWILQCVGFKASEELFFALLQQYRDYCNNSAVLVHLLASFEPAYVSTHALNMTTYIKESDENANVKKSKLYLTLGRALVARSPPQNQRLPILNDVWKVVSKIVDADEYIEIAEVFVQYLLQNFSDREVNIFLKDVIKHVRDTNQSYKRLQPQLAAIVNKIVVHNNDLDKTLAMDNFLPVLDLLDKHSKVPAGKVILGHFAKSKGPTSDPVIIHTLFDIAKSLHDSVDSMSFEDERRQISNLIVRFVRKVDFGRDLEAQLNMFVDFRGAFTNLDDVIREMVQRVALLATKAHSFMKGKHTKKTAAFVKACLAYCHITIPSLDDIISKLYLFLQCGEVALMNGMTVQSEGFLKSAISLIPDVPHIIEVNTSRKSTEEDLVAFLRNFASFLLLFPGHPKHGPFYLIQGLLNAIQQYAPWKTVTPHKTQVFLGMLQLFCTYAQKTFPYHIAGVESNDSLYGGGDVEYLTAVKTFIDQLLTAIAQQIQEIGEKKDILSRKQQGTLALDTLNVAISSLTMNNASATLVVKLYQLAKASDAVDPKYLQNTIEHIANKKGTWYSDILHKIRTTS